MAGGAGGALEEMVLAQTRVDGHDTGKHDYDNAPHKSQYYNTEPRIHDIACYGKFAARGYRPHDAHHMSTVDSSNEPGKIQYGKKAQQQRCNS